PAIGQLATTAPGLIDPSRIRFTILSATFVTELEGTTSRFRETQLDKYRGMVVTCRIVKPAGYKLKLHAPDIALHYNHGDEYDVAPCNGISNFSTERGTDRPMKLLSRGQGSQTTLTSATAAETIYVDFFFQYMEPDTRDIHLCVAQPAGASLVTNGWSNAGGGSIGQIAPRLALNFDETTYFHNMDITYDGRYYYTINGGNESYGRIGRYTPSGSYVGSARVAVDGRSIFYNSNDGRIYIKNYGYDLLRYDPATNQVTTVKTGSFHDPQSHVALDPDGRTLYELADGDIYVMDFPALTDRDTLSGLVGPYAGNALAVSQDYIFTRDEDGTIHAYTKLGMPVAEFSLRSGLYSRCLSWCNNLLWGAIYADGKSEGSTGSWYGYKLEPEVR
ncbi:MAG: hypothetical protein ABIK62_04540, partial [candidate division WOR-3 bacterium]